MKSNSVPDTLLDLALSGVIVPLLNAVGLYVDAEKLDMVLSDMNDKVFYEIVMEKRRFDDAYLVTGNIKHFPKASFIVTPREMLEIIVGNDD